MASVALNTGVGCPNVCSRQVGINAIAHSRPALGGPQMPSRSFSSQLASHNRQAEIQLSWPGPESFYDACDPAVNNGRIDVLGLGQAMIDFQVGNVGDETLADLQLEKGARK